MQVTGFVVHFRHATGVVVAVAALAGAVLAQPPAPEPTGVWIDHTGQGAVEIAPCNPGTPGANPGANRLCGRVVWLKDPAHRSVSGKPICGAQVLGDLRRQGRHVWDSGWIYNPEDEERFSAALELANADTLMVTGYLGVKFLGETFTWKRATTGLEPCTAGTSARR